MITIFKNINSNTMNTVTNAIINSALKVKNENNMFENRISIYCYYTSSELDLAIDNWNFKIELWHTFTGDKLLDGQHRDRRLKTIYYAFDNKNDAHLFAKLIYDGYKNAFGEKGYQYSDLPCVGKSFGSGDIDYDVEKGTGVNFVCSGIELGNFINAEESTITNDDMKVKNLVKRQNIV
jgi:hypothetical protein